MSAALDAAVPAPVGREFLGAARDLRRQIEREDNVVNVTINALTAPIRDRLRRFPQRAARTLCGMN